MQPLAAAMSRIELRIDEAEEEGDIHELEAVVDDLEDWTWFSDTLKEIQELVGEEVECGRST